MKTRLQQQTIITHNGIFHPDEVFAVAMYKAYINSNTSVVRTRDLIKKDNTVFIDVGMKYDNTKYFDHHQFKDTDKLYGKSSAGLIYNKILELNVDVDVPDNLDELVKAIDARDTRFNWDKDNKYEQVLLPSIIDANKLDIKSIEQDKMFDSLVSIIISYLTKDIAYKDMERLLYTISIDNLDNKNQEELDRYMQLKKMGTIQDIPVYRHPKDLYINTHRFFKDKPFIMIHYDDLQDNYTVTCNTDFCTIEDILNKVFIHPNKFMAKTTDIYPCISIKKIKDVEDTVE